MGTVHHRDAHPPALVVVVSSRIPIHLLRNFGSSPSNRPRNHTQSPCGTHRNSDCCGADKIQITYLHRSHHSGLIPLRGDGLGRYGPRGRILRGTLGSLRNCRGRGHRQRLLEIPQQRPHRDSTAPVPTVRHARAVRVTQPSPQRPVPELAFPLRVLAATGMSGACEH